MVLTAIPRPTDEQPGSLLPVRRGSTLIGEPASMVGI
jgi:hypothetical protein